MSLLGKKVSISKFTKPGLMILISVFLGCETANDLGVKYPLESNLNVKYKEFILPAVNIYIDSLRTDQKDFIVAGNYMDPLTGSVSAEGYFSLIYSSSTLPGSLIEMEYEYDSVRISLGIENLLKNSISSTQSLIIGELNNDLATDLVYLSNLKQDTLRQVGAVEFAVENSTDTIFSNFLLSDDFGMDLYELASNASTLSSVDWPSMAILSGANSEVLSSFNLKNDTTKLYLYVKHPDGIEEVNAAGDKVTRDTTYQIVYALTGSRYSYLQRDNSSSEFSGIMEKSDFSIADGRSVIDPLMGLSTAFSIESVTDFFDSNPNIIINDSDIFFELDDSMERDTLETFASYFRKSNKGYVASASSSAQSILSNTIASNASYSGGNVSASLSRLVTNLENDNRASISLNCTQFMNLIYNEYLASGILQFESPFEETPRLIDEFVLIDQSNLNLKRSIFKKDGIKLRIYYTDLGD